MGSERETGRWSNPKRDRFDGFRERQAGGLNQRDMQVS
jgi:hypothetical protein